MAEQTREQEITRQITRWLAAHPEDLAGASKLRLTFHVAGARADSVHVSAHVVRIHEDLSD